MNNVSDKMTADEKRVRAAIGRAIDGEEKVIVLAITLGMAVQLAMEIGATEEQFALVVSASWKAIEAERAKVAALSITMPSR